MSEDTSAAGQKAFKVGDVCNIAFGRVTLADGSRLYRCFACGGEAAAWTWPDGKVAHGIVDIQGPGVHRQKLICQACYDDGDTAGTMIMKKVFAVAPGL
jgi:hypothetical protein